MTDRYAKLRASLDHLENLDHTGVISSWVSQAPAVRALLADYDRMRDALWVVTEHNALHFGESHNTVIVARAALAQEAPDAD